MKLRARKSYVTSLPEGTPARRRGVPVVRWLYFSAMAAVVAYLALYAAQRLMYVEARGYVGMERHLLQADREGVLRGLALRPGQAVSHGQLLFRIEQEVVEDRRDATAAERLRAERDIAVRDAERESLQREAAARSGRLATIGRQKLLELGRDNAREAAALDLQIRADRARAAQLEREIAVLREYQQRLLGQEGYERYNTELPYYSPFDGFVYRVEKGEREFARKGDTVLVLEDADRVRVYAYFGIEDLPVLDVGGSVEVLLPDGRYVDAAIERIDSAAVDSVERLSRGYQPLEALVKATLVPVRSAAALDWRRYNQMDVHVRLPAANWIAFVLFLRNA
jgi:multidrug resistance efflux pump